MCKVLGSSDARQKATVARHLIAAWKDATLALGNQSRRRIDRTAMIAHFCVHRVRCHGSEFPNLPQAESRFFMRLPILN
jgi:hypothetical protein